MKRLNIFFVTAFLVLGLLPPAAFAVKPGQTVNPNGFPSGPHFNLNIIGKKADFVCPDIDVDEYGNPVYGNVIYIPEEGADFQIHMQSGTKGPKSAPDTDTLEVVDCCAGFGNNDNAMLRLPKNDYGYDVYARVLGTPTDDPSIDIFPGLASVEDEQGNDLLYLGLVQNGAFAAENDGEGITLYRVDDSSPGKKPKGAVDITGLFMWMGTVCYIDPLDFPGTDPDANAYDMCLQGGSDPVAPTEDEYGNLVCPEGYTLTTVYCHLYETPTWVFNIADFVDYFWNIDNNGSKLLQVRFYPRTK